MDNTDKLNVEPIGKLLLKFAIPAIIAMTATSLYNIVDSIFIGQGVGPMAISGLAITFPFMNLTAAFGALVGAGAATLISIRLGQGEKEQIKKIFNNMILLNLTLGIGIAVISLIFINPILTFFGASENTIGYAREYMIVILIGNVVTHLYFGINTVLRSLGYPNKSMQATIQTVIINVVLDALFIFVFHMGIRGAAIATVCSQIIALIWQILQIKKMNEIIHLDVRNSRFEKEIVKNIINIGMPQFILNAAACFVAILINKGLMHYGGDFAVGAYGIQNRVVFLFLMISMGLCQGMQPIAGYNYGAGNYKRLMKVFNYSVIFATAITCCCFITGTFFGNFVCSFFTNDSGMIKLSAENLRINVLIMPIIGFQMVTSIFFQSIGKAQVAIILSLSRQVLFYIPALLILPKFWSLEGVWYSAPFADLASATTATVLLLIYLPKLKTLKK